MRVVAHELGGESPCRITAPGGTRNIGDLSRTPADVLRNLPRVCAAIWARIGWARAGYGTYSVSHLLNTARTMTDIELVTFLLLSEDVLGDILRPFTRQAPAKLEPSAMHAAVDHAICSLAAFNRSLLKCRRVLRVLLLLRQHAEPADLPHMLAAFGGCSCFRRLHSFFDAAPGLLKEVPEFHGVLLLVSEASVDSSRYMSIGPHCQCKLVE